MVVVSRGGTAKLRTHSLGSHRGDYFPSTGLASNRFSAKTEQEADCKIPTKFIVCLRTVTKAANDGERTTRMPEHEPVVRVKNHDLFKHMIWEDNSHLLHDGEARVKIFEFEERAALDRM